MGCVGTPPHTWHTYPDNAWHAFSSGSTSSGFSQEAHFSYPDCLKEGQTTLININIRIWLSGSLTEVKQVLHVITTACHSPRSATCRVKGQDEVTTSHFPRSFHMITYHDLWQPHHLPRSLSTAHRVMMALPPPSVIMTTQNISPPLKRGTKLLITIYTNLHTKGKVNLLILVKGQLIYLSLTMADKTFGGCVRTPRPDAFCRWSNWIKNLYWLRSCVHPFGNYVDHQRREASTGWTQVINGINYKLII